MSSVRDRLAAARTAAREDDRNGVQRDSRVSLGQNEAAGASTRPTAVNETTQRRNDAADVRDRLASAREQARKADSTAQTAGASTRPATGKQDNGKDDAGSVSFWQRVWNTAGGVLGDYAEEFLPESGSDFARRMGYNAERAVAAVLGTGESLTDLAGTALYTGVEKAASLGGLAPNAVSEWAGNAADKFLDNSITERYEQSIKERYNPSVGEEKWGNLTEAGANMATAIAAGSASASAVGKASSGAASLLDKADDAARAAKYSKAAFGLQAAGGATNEANDEGATREQALTYGAAVGAMETAIESIAGGIPGLGKGKIGEIARKVVGSPAVSRILDTLGEGGEEALSAFVTPFIKRAVYNKDAASATADEIAESAITGILLSGIAQVGASIAGRAAGKAQEATQETAGARIAQQETVDTEQAENAAGPSTEGNGQGTQTTTGDTLLDAIIKTMQPVTNRQAEAILNDPASASQLGIDTDGMTKSQQRAAVKERVAQMQLEVPGEQIYDRGTDPLLQAIVGGISTQGDVENRNGFDSRSGTGYTENTENAGIGGEQNGTQLDGAAGKGVRAGTGAVGGREYEKGQGPLGQGDLSNPGVVLVNSETDQSGAKIGESTIAPGTVGAAAAGFETPGSQSTERTSNLDTGAAAYNMREGEATSRTREEYDALFRYRTQTEEQSMQAANNMLYYQIDGQPVFLMDFDQESYRAITDSLRQAPAWNGVMTDAAMLIKRELMGRSIDGTVSEDLYTEWLETMREHATETGRGTQAWSKWTRRDNSAGQSSELEALERLQNSNLPEAERTQRFQAIVKFDRSIEAAQTDADLRQIILDIARQRGTLSGLTGKQSKLLERIANASLDGMTFEQLKQFAYSSSAAMSMDASSVNAGAKLKTVQILNMLSNPKTAAKNIAGNTTFYGLDAMTMRGAALLDMALSKIAGTRSVAMESSIFGDRQARADMAKAIRMSLAEITMDVDMGSENNRYQYGGNRTFKAAGTGAFGTNIAADRFLERVLSACERNMGYLMTTTDEAYKGMARSTQRGTQALVDQGKIKNAGKDYAKNQAESLATYRTFQNSGTVATAIQTVHDVLNLVGIGDSGKRLGRGSGAKTVHSFGLGDLVAPFTRVAGNLASVGVDYSPVNAVKGTVEILDTIRNAAMGGEADPSKQAKAVSDFARGMSGTAIAYGVMLLAQAGLVKRAKDEEDEDVASLNRSEGMVGTQVNVDAAKRMLDGGDGSWQTGDTLIDMSNLEPINFIFSLGVELADNGTQGFLSTFGDVNTYKDTYTAIKNAAGDLPVLSGVGDFAKDVLVYNNDPLESGAEMLGKTAISSLTPNSIASLAKGLDDKQRSVYSGDTLTAVLLDTFKSRVPGLRETLPTTVNTLGQEVENPGNQAQRLINAMFNPLGVNQYNQGEVSREMERVRKATGETGFYPAVRKPATLSYTDKDGKEHEVELDYEQKQKFQASCSAVQMSVTADMIGSGLYKNAGSDRQAALLDRCYDYAYQYAKSKVLGEEAADQWVRNAQRARQDLGISTTDFLYYYEKYGGGVMSSSGYEKTKRMVSAGLTIDQWAGFRDQVDTDGNGSVKKAEVTDYIEANFPAGQWSAIFEAYKGNSNWKNPY